MSNTAVPVVETEVSEKARRRRFTAEYKKKILDEADRCTKSGELGALLRREGLFSSHWAMWRKARRERGELIGLQPQKRGPKTREKDERDAKDRRTGAPQRESRKGNRADDTFVEIQKTLGSAWREAPADRRGELMKSVSTMGESLGIAMLCASLGVPRATFYRRQKPATPRTPRPRPV